jgi:general secretion pathway protein G
MTPFAMLAVVAIVVAVLGIVIIAAFASNIVQNADVAKKTAARQQIKMMNTALGAYKLDTNLFPNNEQGLHALRHKPEGVSGWQGPYLVNEIPTDPWSHAYAYKYPGDHGDEPDIISFGADGQPGGTEINEDIVDWISK